MNKIAYYKGKKLNKR